MDHPDWATDSSGSENLPREDGLQSIPPPPVPKLDSIESTLSHYNMLKKQLEDQTTLMKSRIFPREPPRMGPTKAVLKRTTCDARMPLEEPRDTELPAMVVFYGSRDPSPNTNQYPGEKQGRQPMPILNQEPLFIWINSKAIRLRLEHASGTDPDVPVVYLPPFHALISIAELVLSGKAQKEEYRRRTGYDSKVYYTPDSTLMAIPLEELEVLASCFEQDLAPLVAEYRQIRAGTASKIRFEHLWFLFAPGDIAIAQDGGCIQAYQVSRVSGGQMVLPESDGGYPGSENHSIRSLAAAVTHPRRRYEEFVVECLYYYSDGELVGPTKYIFTIRQYDGEIFIDSLPIFPLRFSGNKEAISVSLAQRGSEYMGLTGVAHTYYEGITAREPEEVNSEVIVDIRTAYTGTNEMFHAPPMGILNTSASNGRSPSNARPAATSNHYPVPVQIKYPGPVPEWDTNQAEVWAPNPAGSDAPGTSYLHHGQVRARISDISALDDQRATEFRKEHSYNLEVKSIKRTHPPPEVLMLLPRDVPGFALRNRKWHHFYIERMAAPHNEEGPAEDEFAQLAIPKEHKQLILALVRSHSRGKLATPGKAVDIRPEMDLVRGKGKGLIILLHGVPGVGKTSTAESIASFTKRPLYPITCGDLGETAREVEESLEAHFTLAHRWGCILLLDEADVFLAKRERGDIKRNALVSVFLRVLEYYPGILFLTTNRVGSFDEAFKSRIHIALYYPPLSRDFTLQVWSSCLAQIERQNPQREAPVKFDRGKLLEFAEEQYNSDTPWNGRQIRNAFQTAIALADYERAEKRHEKLCEYNVDDEGELSDSTRRRFQKRFAKVLLAKSHFRQVATAFTKFESYMLEVQQQTDADRAEGEGLRADGWNPNEDSPVSLGKARGVGLGRGKPAMRKKAQDDSYKDDASSHDSGSSSDEGVEDLPLRGV